MSFLSLTAELKKQLCYTCSEMELAIFIFFVADYSIRICYLGIFLYILCCHKIGFLKVAAAFKCLTTEELLKARTEQ